MEKCIKILWKIACFFRESVVILLNRKPFDFPTASLFKPLLNTLTLIFYSPHLHLQSFIAWRNWVSGSQNVEQPVYKYYSCKLSNQQIKFIGALHLHIKIFAKVCLSRIESNLFIGVCNNFFWWEIKKNCQFVYDYKRFL